MAPCLSDVIYLVPQLQVTQLQCREEGRGPLNSQNRCLTVRLLCNHLFLLYITRTSFSSNDAMAVTLKADRRV